MVYSDENIIMSSVVDDKKKSFILIGILTLFSFFYIENLSGIGPKKPLHGVTSATGLNCCPVCGVQIPAEELESHFSAELGRIAKSNMYNERQEIRRTLSMEIHAVQSTLQSRSSRWEVRF